MKRDIHTLFTVIIMDELLIRSLITSFCIALNASVAGTLTVFRKASFLIAGAAHSAFAGAAVAIFVTSFGFSIHYFPLAVAFAILAAILATLSARFGDINTGIAVSFALSMSLAVIVLSRTREYAAKAWQFMFGDLLLLTVNDIVIITVFTSILLLIASFFYYKFLFISFDPDGAEAMGISVKRIDMLLIALISSSVVSAMKAVGAILIFALFVAPAASAKEIGKKTNEILLISFIIAFFSLIAGILISLTYLIPAGAFAAFITSLCYFGITFLKNISQR